MGVLISMLRPEPYYKSCDKYLGKLDVKCTKLKARCEQRSSALKKINENIVFGGVASTVLAAVYASWIYSMSMAETWYSGGGTARKTSVVFFPPLISYFLHRSLSWLTSCLNRVDTKRLEKLEKAKKGLLAELKDSSHYNKIMDLMLKYDPEERKKAALLDFAKKEQIVHRRWSSHDQAIRASPPPHHRIIASTGRVLMPVLDKLANSVIGDNPALIDELSTLQKKLGEVSMEKTRIENENAWLREELMKCRPELCTTMVIAGGEHSDSGQSTDVPHEVEELDGASSSDQIGSE